MKATKPAPVTDRVPAAEVIALLAEHGISRSQFATSFGVTVSRVSEMCTDRRPTSHIARTRWPEVVKAAKSATTSLR